MKRMTAKRGLAALITASMFMTTGAFCASADGPTSEARGVKGSVVMSTSLARGKVQAGISAEEQIHNIIKTCIKPIFRVRGIKASNRDMMMMALLWKKLDLNKVQSITLKSCLICAMEKTREEPYYLDHIYRYYNLENVHSLKDLSFTKIIVILASLGDFSPSAYRQIKKILRIIHSYVY